MADKVVDATMDRRFDMIIGPIICIERGKGEFFYFQGHRWADLKLSDVAFLEEKARDLFAALVEEAKKNAAAG